MKRPATHRRRRLKLLLGVLTALSASAGLLVLSAWLSPPPPPRAAPSPTASGPASAPAERAPPVDPYAAARSLSGMVQLLGLSGLLAAAWFLILLIGDVRQSRPAWKTQHRYPKRR